LWYNPLWRELRIGVSGIGHTMATKVQQKYLVDENGKRVSVVVDIKAYRKILAELEELEAIRAYDAAKSRPDEVITFDQAVQELKKSRR
jgi:hypothetical protein